MNHDVVRRRDLLVSARQLVKIIMDISGVKINFLFVAAIIPVCFFRLLVGHQVLSFCPRLLVCYLIGLVLTFVEGRRDAALSPDVRLLCMRIWRSVEVSSSSLAGQVAQLIGTSPVVVSVGCQPQKHHVKLITV